MLPTPSSMEAGSARPTHCPCRERAEGSLPKDVLDLKALCFIYFDYMSASTLYLFLYYSVSFKIISGYHRDES